MTIWKLPPSLLAIVTLSYLRATAATTSITSSSTDVGAYIVSGLGGATSVTSSTADSDLARAQQQAASCSAEYEAFASSYTSYEQYQGHNTTVKTTFVYTITSSAAPPSRTATSLTTLCDGYARVVGRAPIYNASASLVTSAQTYNYTASASPTTYPGPSPTTVAPADCDLLWSSWSSGYKLVESATTAYSYPLAPACTFAGLEPTCTMCQIVAASARLLYWPVTTVPGSGDLCNKTAETITATPTGPPLTFVTSGITITSPTVGVSFGGMSRMDGCGTTIKDTIIPVRPEEIATVRGAHTFFSHWQFNFADLNYICTSNASSEIPMEERDDCYLAVPANAYLAGHQEALDSMLRQSLNVSLTIWPDYHPQLLPPETMLPMISSIWATNHDQCSINPLGVWDPPVALQEQVSVDGPDVPSPGTTTAVVDSPASETPSAAPVQYSTSPASATGAPETTNLATSDSDLGPSATAVASQSVQDPPGAIASALAGGTNTASQQEVNALQSSATEQSDISESQGASSDPVAADPSTTNTANSETPNESFDAASTEVASPSVQDAAGAIASMLAVGTSTDLQQNVDPLQASAMAQSGLTSTAQSSSGPTATADAVLPVAMDSTITSATLTDLPTISPAASRSLGTTQIDGHTFIFTTNTEGSYTLIDPTTSRNPSGTPTPQETSTVSGGITAARKALVHNNNHESRETPSSQSMPPEYLNEVLPPSQIVHILHFIQTPDPRPEPFLASWGLSIVSPNNDLIAADRPLHKDFMLILQANT
ncbi:hypothetical protein LTR56_007512 [Elasticomyces elasticus]|nr:hypothetical protein LTR56_007512 [Elasticomyces elasticus]KAK3668166.1 hypothetical protein LTR22_000851 [Elasticomyces elasticus]KAK4921388.1 hypothetical protein LTR49_011218 [Elasticomyces elasticus]KAK5769507.1 hypothetical protein LTS12_000434 [Elasticomyces elasticus]